MGRINWNTPAGYYMNKEREKNDKYEGLFDSRQLRDLEGSSEMTGVEFKVVSRQELRKKIKEQKRAGVGSTFYQPFDFSDY